MAEHYPASMPAHGRSAPQESHAPLSEEQSDDQRPDLGDTRLLYRSGLVIVVIVFAGAAAVVGSLLRPDLAIVVSVLVVAVGVTAVIGTVAWYTTAVRAARHDAARHRAATRAARREIAGLAATLDEIQRRTPTVEERTGEWLVSSGALTDTNPDLQTQLREVATKLARRLQSLISRCVRKIDLLEAEIEDPELLDKLYQIDHLAVLSRRQAENLAVLGGEAPERRSSEPVDLHGVLINAVSEVERFAQVVVVPTPPVRLHGHGVAEIIHLLAELLENATQNTNPEAPKVEIRSNIVTAGLAVDIADRGLGLNYEDIQRINRVLAGEDQEVIVELLNAGSMGLVVVRELARRNNIAVQLQTNISGGVTAVVVIPRVMLALDEIPDQAPRRRHLEAATPAAGRGTQGQPLASHALTSAAPDHAHVDAQGDTTRPGAVAPWSTPASAPLVAPVLASAVHESPAGRTSAPSPHRRSDLPEFGPSAQPPLPARAARREPPDDAATQTVGVADGAHPPQLPVRRGSYMPEELRNGPVGATPVPGHTPDLMSSVLAGQRDWRTEQADSDRPAHYDDRAPHAEQDDRPRADGWPTSPPAQTPTDESRGTHTTWPNHS